MLFYKYSFKYFAYNKIFVVNVVCYNKKWKNILIDDLHPKFLK